MIGRSSEDIRASRQVEVKTNVASGLTLIVYVPASLVVAASFEFFTLTVTPARAVSPRVIFPVTVIFCAKAVAQSAREKSNSTAGLNFSKGK